MALLRREGATVVVCVLLSSVAAPPPPCSFEYRRQPPSTTLNGCNPYQVGTGVILVSLESAVKRRAMVTDEYEVRWFRENTTGAIEDLGLGYPDILLGMEWISRYHDKAFRDQRYSPSLLGKYWCQVINTTADPEQPLMRSNVFTLLAPGNYSGPPCTVVQEVTSMTCADLQSISSTSIANIVSTMYHNNAVDHVTTSSHPSPTGSGMPPSTTLTIAGVSASVVLVLLLVIVCSSTLIVILIVMKRRKARNKQQLHSGGYSDNAVGFNNCTKNNINLQPNSTATITSPQQQPVIYDQPDDLKRTMSAASKGGNVINSEYSCLTDATTSGPSPAAAPVLFDDPMYDAAGVSNNQYSHLENAVTGGGDTAYSKLGYNQAAITNTLPTVTGDDQYSSLNTCSNTVGRGDSSKLAAGYGEQEYSSLQHRGMPAAPSDMMGHTTADQQQYSVLNTCDH